ncbi:MAG: hypothetical protein OXF64_07080, partial [bacterium]|nr:hypothetical protein [bacterium]
GPGNDVLLGGAGNDMMYGDSVGVLGQDLGDAGVDTLHGGAGDDVMWGGSGADAFVFSAGDGHDVINDFESGADVIDLSSMCDIESFDDLNIRQDGANTVVVLSDLGTDSISLVDFDSADLSAADFIFCDAI